jgi:transcriptional regulator with GAF, ATPase, and Fis domain
VVVPPAVAAALTRGLEEVSKHAMSEAPLDAVMQLLMTHMHEALKLQRVLLCLRDAASGELRGRVGLGERAGALAPVFRVPMHPPADLFGVLCAKNADTLISDASDTLIAQRLPGWFHQQVGAATFLLLPLQLGGQPVGMIYADRQTAHSLLVGDGELTLLRAMRNQLVMAMRLRGATG